jgi:hypothetical protein
MLCYVVNSNVLVTWGYGFYHFPTTSMPMKWRSCTSRAKKDDGIEQGWPLLATFGPLGACWKSQLPSKNTMWLFWNAFQVKLSTLGDLQKGHQVFRKVGEHCWGCALLSTVNLSMQASSTLIPPVCIWLAQRDWLMRIISSKLICIWSSKEIEKRDLPISQAFKKFVKWIVTPGWP